MCLQAPIDLLLATLLVLFADVTSGVIIASSDVLLDLDESAPVGVSPTTRYLSTRLVIVVNLSFIDCLSCRYVWPDVGATGLAFPAHVSYGPHHGAYTVKPDEPGATPSTSTNGE